MSPANRSPVPTPETPGLQGKGETSGDGGNRTHATFPPSHPPCGTSEDTLRRCRISLTTTREYKPETAKTHVLDTTVSTGWGEIDATGQWLHFHDDTGTCWQSFSRGHVNWIDWETPA